MRIRSIVAVAAASALAAGASSAIAGSSGGGGHEPGGHARFATVKQGTTLVLFGAGGTRAVHIHGLAAGERVVGLDVRPANHKLYGISSANRVFTIEIGTGQIGNAQTLSVPLSGTDFDIDFNPSVDRLRIVSDADQNLRANVDTGATLNDAALNYPAGDRNAGKNPNVIGAGYTYAALGGPTALYDVDSFTDAFTLQNPPNAGTLSSIGPVGIDIPVNQVQGGFDIAGRDPFTAYGFYQQGDRANLYEHRFDRNGAVSPTGTSLVGSYDGFAVLDA